MSDWALAPDVVHLNHGSYGGCPRAVLEASAALRARLEAAPMRFFVLEWQAEVDRARSALAELVRAPDDRLAFVPSATAGVQIALDSTPVAAGDELLVLEDGYRACKNQLARLAHERGAAVVTVPMPRPFDADQLVDAVRRAVTPRTRIALLDHVTSPTAIVVPLERLLPRRRRRASSSPPTPRARVRSSCRTVPLPSTARPIASTRSSTGPAPMIRPRT